MAKLKDLVVAIGANTTDFDKKLGKSMHKIKAFGKNTKRLGKDLSMSLTAPIAALGFTAVKAFQQQAKAIAQVEAGLKSTGASVGFTSQQLQQMASDLQSKTLFGDEQILQDATAQLLTFTNISGEQFKRTQQAALDLATRLDGDLKGASIQLGKALNDPVANLSALSRSGIQFSDEQKEVIKSMAETGRLAEAQTLILDELNKQYGGSAEAAAKADGGFTQLANSFGDLQEEFGKIMVEVLRPVIDYLRDLVARFQAMSPEMKKTIVTLSLVAAAIGPLIFIAGQLAQSFYALKLAATGLKGSMIANPYVLVGAAIAALGIAAYNAQQPVFNLQNKVDDFSKSLPGAPTKNWEDYMDSIERGTASLGEAADGFVALRKEIEETAKTAASNQGWVESFRAGSPVLAEILDLFTNYDEQLKDAAKAAANLDETERKAINNKEWAAIADERLAELGGEREKVESDVADQIERQRINLESMLSAQEKARQAADKMRQAFQDAGVAEAIQPMRGGQGERGLMMAGDRANTNLGLPSLDSVDRTADEVENRMEEMNLKMSNIANAISGNLTNAFSSLFRGLMDGTQSFGEFMKQVLTDLLIKLASMAAAFLLISALLPGSSIAQGGLGAFLQGGFGLTPFADGGIVSGPTAALVGEYSGARTNPEVIAPLDKLQSMIQGAGGGNVTVTGRISGSDILLSSERSNIYRNRVRGY